jgi:hypothetical protein
MTNLDEIRRARMNQLLDELTNAGVFTSRPQTYNTFHGTWSLAIASDGYQCRLTDRFHDGRWRPQPWHVEGHQWYLLVDLLNSRASIEKASPEVRARLEEVLVKLNFTEKW